MKKHQGTLSILAVLPLAHAQPMPDGFQFTNFAGPPQVEYPTCVIAGANGDVFVSSDKNGSLGHKPGFGKIVRCRDTDGDGKADQFVDFVPSVDSPRGGHFVGDTLYLIHPPFLSSFRDTNGDGVADEKKTLLTGLGGGIEHPRGADHTTNGVRMGIDGWLYISVGDFGTTPAKGTDGKTYTLHGGGVIRVRPDGTRVEPYALMVRNICDTAISPTMDMFSRDNTNDGKGWNTRFHHYTALGDHGYPRLYQNFANEAIVPLADYGGGSGTGALWLSEPGFPAEYTDALFSTDWTTGTVHLHPWKRVGASFQVEQKTFLKVPRAIDIDVDGFSRLYIADWRGGGYNFGGPGKPVGMIQRAIYTKAEPAKYQDVAKAADNALAALLGSPSAVQRLEASRELIKRGGKPAFAHGIMAVAKDSSKPIGARFAAVFTFAQLYGNGGVKYLVELAADQALREAALRAMAEIPDAQLPKDLYVKSLTDADPRVVLQAIVGLDRMKATDAAPAILDASKNWKEPGVSPRLQHTAMQALARLGNVPALLSAVPDKATSTLALRALERIHSDAAVDGLLALVPASEDPDTRIAVIAALARLSFKDKEWDLKSWWNTKPDDRGPYYEPVPWEATARIRPAIEKGFEMIPRSRQKGLLDLLKINRLPVGEMNLKIDDPLANLLNSKNIPITAIDILEKGALDPSREISQRIQAYHAMAKLGALESHLQRVRVLAAWFTEGEAKAPGTKTLITDFVNSPERGAEIPVLRGIAAQHDDAIGILAWKAILSVYRSPLAAADAKTIAKSFIDANPAEAAFFTAIKEIGMTGLDAQINAAKSSPNHEVAAAAQAAAASLKPEPQGKKVGEMNPDEVQKIVMTAKGDAKRGAHLYITQGCIACHSVDKNAEIKGPFLGSAGAKFSRDYLIESVLDPNKAVAQGAPSLLYMTKDGGSVMGFISNEADGIIEMRDVGGKIQRVKRENITSEMHLPNSMMPPGLAAGLTVEDFTNLIEYLMSQKQKGG